MDAPGGSVCPGAHVFMTTETDIAAPTLAENAIGPFTFEDGTTLSDAAFTYALDRPTGGADGLVILCPSLTATPDILRAWWHDIAPQYALERYAVLYAHAFSRETVAVLPRRNPPTIRDLARGILALVRALQLPQPTFVTGGSMGGMLALEVTIESGAPTHGLILAAPAVQTAWGAGWNQVQLQAIEIGGPARGLALARAVGMLTYRTEREFESRFGVDADADDGRTMRSYLQHHGDKLVERFDAAEYERRVRAMDTHDVGRHRGSWRDALRPHAARLTGVGVIGDTLYSADIVREWSAAASAAFESITSIHGHDAFLLETAQVRALVDAAFTRAVREQPVR
jgi:homoserine O-acetyltransferase/O-succinyltransferase